MIFDVYVPALIAGPSIDRLYAFPLPVKESAEVALVYLTLTVCPSGSETSNGIEGVSKALKIQLPSYEVVMTGAELDSDH